MNQHAYSSQQQASDPAHSVWVNASAGTGKTKVLTDRVLRLLLEGVAPERILCLTFTNAAAAEMKSRIYAQLSRWSALEEEVLAAEVAQLFGRPMGGTMVSTARGLFAAMVDHLGDMRIQTLHAFCQSILKRFPMESGVVPHFQVADAQTTYSLLEEAKKRFLAHSDTAPESTRAAVEHVAKSIPDMQLHRLIQHFIEQRSKISGYIATGDGIAGVVKGIYARLKVPEGVNREDVLCGAYAPVKAARDSALQHAAEVLLQGRVTDAARGESIAAWLQLKETERIARFSGYAQAFVTQEGTPRKKLATQKICEEHPDVEAVLLHEQECVLLAMKQLWAWDTARLTESMLYIMESILILYTEEKRRHAFLDFSDLITLTERLLTRTDIAPWVMYKLDGGIDHILVDEAQDTSAEQWRIIDGLCSEFFAGCGVDEEVQRTLFVVGDAKQSIFSFQGADPKAFYAMHQLFATRAQEALQPWHTVAMDVSFRSTEAVLKTVDGVFADGVAVKGLEEAGVQHSAHRIEAPGMVELWPVVTYEREKQEKQELWPLPVVREAPPHPRSILAQQIAERIACWLAEGCELAAKKRAIRPSDIMILVRTRTLFVDELVAALHTRDVPVSGVDRIMLTDHIAVEDLMALGHFLLLPEDDLTLATVLKSPLIGLDEEELFTLAYDRGKKTLWQSLQEKHEENLRFSKACVLLQALLKQVDFMPPFTLYAHILDVEEGRKHMIGRLGYEVGEVLDAFLDLALQYERTHTPSLQGFLHWLEKGHVEIKRNTESEEDVVRIMTVHGAKGLQAPIVFMPDTTNVPAAKAGEVLWAEDGVPLCPVSTRELDPYCSRLAQEKRDEEYEEYLRLLYVAMTRAEDVLLVCGWSFYGEVAEESWYHLVHKGMTRAEAEEDKDGQGWRVVSGKEAALQPTERVPEVVEEVKEDLPMFALTLAPEERPPIAGLRPHKAHLEEGTGAGRSPLYQDAEMVEAAKEIGKLKHRLLQLLPYVPEERQWVFAEEIVRQYAGVIPMLKEEAYAEQLIERMIAVVHHPEFAGIFGPQSEGEVPVAGTIGVRFVYLGKVDRIAVEEKEVIVVDYKSDKNPPKVPEDISERYLAQMTSYWALLKGIYPEKRVRCVFLWLENFTLMEVEESLLARYRNLVL